jgi:hypothetical protein
MKEIDPLPAFGSTNSLNCRAEGHLIQPHQAQKTIFNAVVAKLLVPG